MDEFEPELPTAFPLGPVHDGLAGFAESLGAPELFWRADVS